jgi:hypothetical protein
MDREKKPPFRDSDGELGDFVPAVFARSLEEAEDYRQLLDDHDIPAIVGDEGTGNKTGRPALRKGFSRGVPVLVPEALLEEAGDVIAERDETDAFGREDETEEEEDEEVLGLEPPAPEAIEGALEEEDEEEEDEDEDEETEEDDLFGEGLEGDEDEDDDDEEL